MLPQQLQERERSVAGGAGWSDEVLSAEQRLAGFRGNYCPEAVYDLRTPHMSPTTYTNHTRDCSVACADEKSEEEREGIDLTSIPERPIIYR